MDRREELQRTQELLHFIKWKLRFDKEYLEEVMPELKKMNLNQLEKWAIRNDIID